MGVTYLPLLTFLLMLINNAGDVPLGGLVGFGAPCLRRQIIRIASRSTILYIQDYSLYFHGLVKNIHNYSYSSSSFL